MEKKEQLQPLHVGSSLERNGEECRLYELLDVGLKVGRYGFFGLSYSITPANYGEFSLKSCSRQKSFLLLLHVCFILYVLIPAITESINFNPCCLMNMIKKATHIIFQLTMVAIHYSFEIRGRRLGRGGLLAIFRQCIIVQEKCHRLGLHFPSRRRVRRFAWAVSITSCIFCVGRQYVFTRFKKPWYTWHAVSISRMMTLGMWTPENSTISAEVHQAIGITGVVFDGMIANYWYFCQFFCFFLVLTAWSVFDKLNKAMKSDKLKIKQLPEVIDLHFQSTKLLNLINEFASAMTFWVMAYTIVMMCYWTNYMTMSDFSRRRGYYVGAIVFFLKITIELLFQADVNSKAHKISDWLEESYATTESFPQVDPTKLAIFTAQVYNKDSIGFKGFNFFVVTPQLIIPIVGIVVTYTVAVNQFCHTSLN